MIIAENGPTTARAILRRRECRLGTPKGRFENARIQTRIQKMTNRERVAWARGGHPTEDEEIEQCLLDAWVQWQGYKAARRMLHTVTFGAISLREGEFTLEPLFDEFVQEWGGEWP